MNGTFDPPATGKRVIPGTYVFDGDAARRGFAINEMCFSFNEDANRRAFAEDEEAYMERFHLSEEHKKAIRERDVIGMLNAGGNIYYLAKLAGILKLGVQDIGALQTGTTVDEFKAALLAHGAKLKELQTQGETA
ncbi:protocatechuate 4,5-dioxygenase subunit alpha [Altericroceibacterium endophyticum]|uniref:Protocatechuate 4,5-dioxygenase subunit alpha n=1 Tax=Altericroceibacterium endophyticum TaxID=1808508 RepID=A0A6I4T4S6_9SPHN|nr:protocatechuate 4,5-dioxygenase subunit alpha [Altericroceibacterium endophyticum]MXO65151.1 protocatechuate 4,5-dioxygenase subunit alpha [Altericroceibacterium endophyticum]